MAAFLGISAFVWAAAAAVAASAASAGISVKTNNNRLSQAQTTMDWNAMQSYRNQQLNRMNAMSNHQKFMADMSFKGKQLAFQMDNFTQDMLYKQNLLEFEIQGQEDQLMAENMNRLAELDFAGKTMESAFDAELIDMELLGTQWEEISDANALAKFERKRQSLKEQAQIRVSQGESGIFGNTALKELANSQMQESWDVGILGYNLKNKSKQTEANAKKIKSTKTSRVNEALAGIARPLNGSMNGSMNGAYAGLTID